MMASIQGSRSFTVENLDLIISGLFCSMMKEVNEHLFFF